MNWDRDDFRSLSRRPEWGRNIPQPHYTSDAAILREFPEARVRHLAEHLNSLGRLNIYILAAEWGLSPIDVVQWLTALHHEGLFDRMDDSPYFRVTSSDNRSEKQRLP